MSDFKGIGFSLLMLEYSAAMFLCSTFTSHTAAKDLDRNMVRAPAVVIEIDESTGVGCIASIHKKT